jgi:hypothetical protein
LALPFKSSRKSGINRRSGFCLFPYSSLLT